MLRLHLLEKGILQLGCQVECPRQTHRLSLGHFQWADDSLAGKR